MFPRLTVVIVAIALFLSACSTDPLVARLEENPMASPTLTFAEASFSETLEATEDNGDPSLTFTRVQAQTGFFPLEADLVAQGRDELLEQARASGFELVRDHEGVTDESGVGTEFWTARNDEGLTLFLEVTEDRLTVNLFLDG